MSDPIKAHLKGYAATLAALDLIRRGVAPDEAAARLLIDLAGKADCLESFTDKELRKLSNKLNWSAQTLIRAAHATHSVFTEALEDIGAIPPVADSRAPTSKPMTSERREYMKHFMRAKRAREAAERKANATAAA
jgi:hypothetical protein